MGSADAVVCQRAHVAEMADHGLHEAGPDRDRRLTVAVSAVQIRDDGGGFIDFSDAGQVARALRTQAIDFERILARLDLGLESQ